MSEDNALGIPPFGTELQPIDFARFAEACRGVGFACARGVVVLYTPRDEEERAVSHSLFFESYNCSRTGRAEIAENDRLLSYKAMTKASC